MQTVVKLLIAALALAMLAGCATSNSVRLDYKAVAETQVACPGSVTVVRFEDARDNDAIGVKKDGTEFWSSRPVEEWVSKALYDELKRAECSMAFHEVEYKPVTDYVVTGRVEKVWLEEKSLTDYVTSLKLHVKMVDVARNKVVYEQDLTGAVEKKVVPDQDNPGEIMTSALQDLMLTITADLLRAMGAAG